MASHESTVLGISPLNTRLKWVVLSVSVLISGGSIVYTNYLISDLKARERLQVELFAKALEYSVQDESGSNFIAQEILFQNNSIPIILVSQQGSIIDHRNIDLNAEWSKEKSDAFLQRELRIMEATFPPIRVPLRDPQTFELFETQLVYYKNSALLSQLIAYPYIQLSVIAIFGFISYLAFNYSKAAEQNRVWVGLAKETAHQLGTPLSSLMAWLEVIKEDPQMKNHGLVDELEKDVRKLQIVTERFSSIGSAPVLKEENVLQLVNNVVEYLRPRVSPKIKIEVFTLSDKITAMASAPLFEWVIENLCKNAVDAMGNAGTIAIKILRGVDGHVFVDVSDTGKGIPKALQPMVFKPGFTTKKRGWGLGLTLAQRIIEGYHNGRITVRSSEETQGTTFRIALESPSKPV
jgi:signal transduction histidine kinase